MPWGHESFLGAKMSTLAPNCPLRAPFTYTDARRQSPRQTGIAAAADSLDNLLMREEPGLAPVLRGGLRYD